jgi:HK97 family phage portal protein
MRGIQTFHAALIDHLRRIGRAALRAGSSLIPGNLAGFSFGNPVLSGVVVTPQTALTLTAFYAGVNVIATDVAKLPLGFYRQTTSEGKQPLADDPRHRIVRYKPNPETNAVRYWQMVMGHTLGWGNHYSEIVRDGSGTATALWPLNPGTTKPVRDDKGALYYEDSNTKKRWRPEQILHIAGLSFDGIYGYSPATMGRQAIGLGMGAEQFGASLFGNGAIPNGMLETPKKLSEVAVKRLRQSFEHVHAGPQNANRVAILEEGLKFVQTQISPEAAQFLATRQFQILEICRLLNLPPHKLGDYSQSHLANVEESNLDYVTNCLGGWLDVVCAELEDKFLFDEERGQIFAEHDMARLLRGNMNARADYYVKLKTNGIVSADTVAAKEGLPIPGPANGGDRYMVQSQNVPAEETGEPLAAVGEGTEPDEPATVPIAEPSTGAPATDVQATALNGAQITSLVQIVEAVTAGTIPIATAAGMIAASFPTLTTEQINAILDPLIGFEPESEPAGTQGTQGGEPAPMPEPQSEAA